MSKDLFSIRPLKRPVEKPLKPTKQPVEAGNPIDSMGELSIQLNNITPLKKERTNQIIKAIKSIRRIQWMDNSFVKLVNDFTDRVIKFLICNNWVKKDTIVPHISTEITCRDLKDTTKLDKQLDTIVLPATDLKIMKEILKELSI